MTTLLLAFALVLMAAVLLSGLANRTVLSTAVIFLVAGFVLGDGVTGVVSLTPDSDGVGTLAELALFSVLFSDGMKVGWQDLRSAWRLPGRALALGLPLTLVATAVLAFWLTGLGWTESLLLGAVLSPTDPVFASALVGNDKVPGRLRHLLNVESGVNDGLALPFVIVLLALADEAEGLHLGQLAGEIGLGLVIGVAVPMVALWLERRPWFSASGRYEPLNAVAIGLAVLALAQATHANLYLAAFSAGITVTTCGQRQREAFEEFGELVAELLKLAALLVFGALITPDFLAEISFGGWVFAVAALVVARPLALWIAFLGSRLGVREQVAAMWFGPKGFASVVYGLLVLHAGIPAGNEVFHLVALTIVLSILAHSSTDVVVARWFDEEREVPGWYQRGRDGRRRTASRSRGRR
jgi:NhaP-type Na+/H+ or K+/H+ antiporter